MWTHNTNQQQPGKNKTKQNQPCHATNQATDDCLSLWGVSVIACFLFCEGVLGMNFLALSSYLLSV